MLEKASSSRTAVVDVDLARRKQGDSELLVLQRVATNASINHDAKESSREGLLATETCLRRLPRCRGALVADGQRMDHGAVGILAPFVRSLSSMHAKPLEHRAAQDACAGEDHPVPMAPMVPLGHLHVEAAQLRLTADLFAVALMTVWYDGVDGP